MIIISMVLRTASKAESITLVHITSIRIFYRLFSLVILLTHAHAVSVASKLASISAQSLSPLSSYLKVFRNCFRNRRLAAGTAKPLYRVSPSPGPASPRGQPLSSWYRRHFCCGGTTWHDPPPPLTPLFVLPLLFFFTLFLFCLIFFLVAVDLIFCYVTLRYVHRVVPLKISRAESASLVFLFFFLLYNLLLLLLLLLFDEFETPASSLIINLVRR